MQVQPISNQQPFRAVNQKYFAWAKEDIRLIKNVSTEWCDRLSFDVFLLKKISRQDAIDTVEAIKKNMKKTDEGLEHLLNTFKNPNP